MRRYKNILLVYGSDQRTLDRAVALARVNRARLTVIDVVKKLDDSSVVIRSGAARLDVQALVIKNLAEQLKEFTDSAKGDGLRVRSKVLVGSPFLEIIREVIRGQHDLVIMAAEGKSGLSERLFGGTSLHLMRECPCPVLVTKPTRRKRMTKILAAVDPDPFDETRHSLNAQIMELAASMANAEQAELHVVHAWTLYGEALLEGLAGLQAEEVKRIIKQEAVKRRQLAESVIAPHLALSPKLHVVKGDASDVIPRIAASQAIDLLVMGTVCRTGIAGFLIGNTAETVLNKVDCSVLAIKPEGFVSPIQLLDK